MWFGVIFEMYETASYFTVTYTYTTNQGQAALGRSSMADSFSLLFMLFCIPFYLDNMTEKEGLSQLHHWYTRSFH